MKTVVILILIYIAYRVLKRLFYFRVIHHPHHSGGHDPQGRADEDLVLDPVCGSYVPVHTAITLDRDGVRRHFCSVECRDKFLGADHD